MVIPDIKEPIWTGPGAGPTRVPAAAPAPGTSGPETPILGPDPFRQDAVANYAADCARYGIDRHLGLIDPMAYALEVVSRLGSQENPPADRT
ncbi:MAG: hypothetical protein RLY86_1054 [Pseudomonadota bacterium]|jgi:hypothetical protein